MGEFAVFSEPVAMGLLARGFKLRGMTEKAWMFDDSVLLRRAVEELTIDLQ
jgi:hypothetical protein